MHWRRHLVAQTQAYKYKIKLSICNILSNHNEMSQHTLFELSIISNSALLRLSAWPISNSHGSVAPSVLFFRHLRTLTKNYSKLKNRKLKKMKICIKKLVSLTQQVACLKGILLSHLGLILESVMNFSLACILIV